MLGPVRDGGRIEFLTVPGCWGPMMTPSLRSGHEVTLPVRVDGAHLGDALVVQNPVIGTARAQVGEAAMTLHSSTFRAV